jgi:hypothetical protein
MINITGSLGLPIRYNPDQYKPATGESWSTKSRLDQLAEVIRYWQAHPLPATGQTFVIYLFYDGDDHNFWREPQLLC